jgi:hypothetical protein
MGTLYCNGLDNQDGGDMRVMLRTDPRTTKCDCDYSSALVEKSWDDNPNAILNAEGGTERVTVYFGDWKIWDIDVEHLIIVEE